MDNIIINGIKWKIKYVKANDPILRRRDGTYTIGCTNNLDKTISIYYGLNDYMFSKVLTHEVCHALIFSYGIYFDEFTEELICDFVANYGLEVVEIVGDFLKNNSKKFFQKV